MILACIILSALELLGIIYLALCSLTILKEIITLRADTEFLKDLHSKEYAEKTADLLVREGYVKSSKEFDMESAKKLLYENRT